MTDIKGYHLYGELSTHNAGFSRWAICHRDGRDYFIKEFLTPVYPVETEGLSERLIMRKRTLCARFYELKLMFYKELRACRTGNNIVTQDFFRWGSHYYIVTDRVYEEGIGPAYVSALSSERKQAFVRSLLYSVSALHEHHLVHADLKPDNLIVKRTTDGYCTAKIIDFDAGFIVGEPPSELQGDFVYLAPEVYLRMEGAEVDLDEKLDVFALGILVHLYWTGELPRFASTYRYAFEAVLSNGVITLSDRLPAPVRPLVMRMLSKRPEDRPTCADALREFAAAFELAPAPVAPAPADEVATGWGEEPPEEGNRLEFFVPDTLG